MGKDVTVAGPTLSPGKISIKRQVMEVCSTESPRCSYLSRAECQNRVSICGNAVGHPLFVIGAEVVVVILKDMGSSSVEAAVGKYLLLNGRRIDRRQRRKETIISSKIRPGNEKRL